MNILLIGSTGQLGGWFIPVLEAYGHVQIDPRYDIREPENFRVYCHEQCVDAVINAAGWNNRRCLGSPDAEAEAYEVNGKAAGEMSELCQEMEIPFYHISTEYVFGSGNGVGPFSEEVTPLPDSLYGQTKLCGDKAVLAAQGHVLRVSLLADLFRHEVAATNIISSKLRASVACERVIEYVTRGLADGKRVPLLHICGERRSIAEFVRNELGRTDVRFEPLSDNVPRPYDSSLCSIYS